MDFQCYCSVPILRQTETVLVTGDTLDNDRRLARLREASANVTAICGKREFQPRLDTRAYDYLSPDYVSFRGDDLLALTTLTDGTGVVIPAAALIMEGARYRDATKWGPWYGAHVDTSQAQINESGTDYGAIKVVGVYGCHDDYGVAGANAWAPVYTDSTLVNPLVPAGGVNATQRTIQLGSDPTVSYDALLQAWPLKDNTPQGAIGAGSLIQMDSEWLQVMNVTGATGLPSNTLSVQRGVNGSTAATHTSSSAISVFQVLTDVREATRIWAHYLLRKDPAAFGKTVPQKVGGVEMVFPEEIVSLLLPYKKTWTA